MKTIIHVSEVRADPGTVFEALTSIEGLGSFEGRDGATKLRFRQEYANELSDDDYGTYNYNWGYYLEILRLYVEAGAGKPFAAQGAG
jgi:hypothetical protein